MRRTGYACLALGVLSVLATPVVVFWCVGDLSSPGLTPENADYALRPPSWTQPDIRVAGQGALSVVVIAVTLICLAVRWRLLRAKWLGVIALLMGVGAVVALGYRVGTAAVIGANIGWGLFILGGPPICVAMVVVASIISYKLMRAGNPPILRSAR